MGKEFLALGYDIGGTKIAASLGRSDGKILASRRIDNKHRAPAEVLPEMVAAGQEMLAEAKLAQSELRAIGICAPAPMDIPNGLILAPPNNKTWENVAIRDYLSGHFKTEAFLENDANAGALAEWIFGAGKGAEDMIYLTMSTGIGGGVICNGRLVHGKNYLAGELGHVVVDINGPRCNCGLKGCYEAICGGRAVAQKLQTELAKEPNHPIVKAVGGKLEDIDFAVFVDAVRGGDPYSVKLWDELCLRHAQAIGIFINSFNPEKIVLGTIAWATGDLFMEPVMRRLPDFCWEEQRKSCEVTVSALRHDIGNYAGICVALNNLHERGEFPLPR